MIREVFHWEQTDIGLYERRVYKSEEYNNFYTYEISTKIGKLFARIVLVKNEFERFEKMSKNNYYAIFAIGNKKDVNGFTTSFGTKTNKIHLKSTTKTLAGLLFAKKALEFIIERMKLQYDKFSIIIFSDDKKRFNAYKRLEKVGFIKNGFDFSNTKCYYYYNYKKGEDNV